MTKPASKPIVLIIGTRPEGIKMIPLYFALQHAGLNPLICSTMQHKELLDDVFNLFNVKPDISLDVMRPNQDLSYLTQTILEKTTAFFAHCNPALVLVQGDTTSTMASALAAFYSKIPVGHVEAGLRTDDISSPFPEEMNRRVVSIIARYHFAPTQQCVDQLCAQGMSSSRIFCTGNTVVDALRLITEKIEQKKIVVRSHIKKQVATCRKAKQRIFVLTTHRRESFDGGIIRILRSIKQFLLTHPNVFCFYPFHPNPYVLKAIKIVGLTGLENLFLSEPLLYPDIIYLLRESDFIATDSGGIQEEAISLGKPVLVLREKTERTEGLHSGIAQLVGTDPHKIREGMVHVLRRKKKISDQARTVYGDGYAADKIAAILQQNVDEYRGQFDRCIKSIRSVKRMNI